jgi:hypothetical protein
MSEYDGGFAILLGWLHATHIDMDEALPQNGFFSTSCMTVTGGNERRYWRS